MWLNSEKITDSAIADYRETVLNSCPNNVVIDGLFDEARLDQVWRDLQLSSSWQTQRHTYSALYVDQNQWQKASREQRFVQRDVWLRDAAGSDASNKALAFLSFLRGDEFMSLLSRIFNVALTDLTVAEPDINTNYFRLSVDDFVEQHADDSPGRELCMLLYLNKHWNQDSGGELCFNSKVDDEPISIAPLFNRCVLFDPSSEGSEHWVKQLNSDCSDDSDKYRYNVTSWYWSI